MFKNFLILRYCRVVFNIFVLVSSLNYNLYAQIIPIDEDRENSPTPLLPPHQLDVPKEIVPLSQEEISENNKEVEIPLVESTLTHQADQINDNIQEIRETQEVNYTKAIISLNDDNYGHAMFYLMKNLRPGLPAHLESLELLANIHEKRRLPLKAIRVYYYIINYFHGPTILKERRTEVIEEMNKYLARPTEKTLSYFFKIAELYFEMMDDVQETKINEKDLRHLAVKYYTICKVFNYQRASASYKLGLMKKQDGLKFEVTEDYLDAKLHIDKSPDFSGKEEFQQTINFYLADSFLNLGQGDLAIKYFRGVKNSKASESLRNYAKLYYESLTQSYLTYTISYLYGNDSNVNGLTDKNRANFGSLQPTYGSIGGTYSQKNIDIFYNNSLTQNWSYNYSFGLNLQNYSDHLLERSDTRTLNFSAELKRYLRKDALLKMTVASTKVDSKLMTGSKFKTDSYYTTTSITADFWLTKGLISWSIPYTVTNTYSTTGNSYELGSNVNFTTYGINRFLVPSFLGSYSAVKGGNLQSNSQRYQLAISNQSQIVSWFTLYSTVNFSKELTSIRSQQSELFGYTLVVIIDLDILVPGLVAKANYDFSVTQSGEGLKDQINRTNSYAGLSLSF